MSKHFLVHRGSFNQACSSEYLLCGAFFLPAFGGCYWKPWLQALIVYFVLPFSWRPSHDNAVGMTDKAGQKFHRSSANCQDDGWVTQQIILRFVKQKHVTMLLFSIMNHLHSILQTKISLLVKSNTIWRKCNAARIKRHEHNEETWINISSEMLNVSIKCCFPTIS